MIDNLIFAGLFVVITQISGFLLGFSGKTDKYTDLFYGMTFVLLSFLLLFYSRAVFISKLLLAAMITAWGLRLSLFLFRRIGKIKKDSRFDEMRHSFVKFGMFWLLQAVSIFIIMLPVTIFLSLPSETQLGFFSALGFFVWLSGLIIESFADSQKDKFRENKENKGKWIEEGLWKYSRHPNYFGEMLCWVGVFIYVFPALAGWLFISALSPLFIIFLLLFVSGIPILERKAEEKWGHDKKYQEYKKRTSILIPLPPKHI